MKERKHLNRLVVMTLQETDTNLKARQIYEQIRTDNPKVMRKESVKGFRSFVKIINSFEQVKQIGSGVKRYTIEK